MSDRVTQIESALETIAAAGATLAPIVDRDGGRALLAYWQHQLVEQPAWSAAASAIAARLVALCRSRAVVEVLAAALPPGLADVVMVWAESAAARAEVALSPLIGAHAATPALRERAAGARLQHGPLFDAIHCLPAVWGRDGVDARIRQLVWEAGARGLVLPVLGRWAWSTPGVVRALVIDPARGHLGDRVRAARALALLADGWSEDSSPGLARVVIGVAQTLVQHREPAVWGAAARGLGRFAHGSSSARMTVFQAVTSERLSVRRRNVATIGSLSPAVGADTWIEEQLDRVMAETARKDDPWQLAALAIATPHLARDRPEHWQALCEIALASPSLELAWSLAQGLAILARHGAGRGWIAGEERVAIALHAQLAALPIEQPIDHARRLEAIASLDRALGRTPGIALVADQLDARLHAAIEGRDAPAPELPREAFDRALAQLAGADAPTAGRAIAAIRSATRAQAMRLPELVLGAGALAADGEHMLATVAGRLADDTCEFGTRATAVGVLTDLVAGQTPGAGFGPVSAQALLAVAQSRWLRELADARNLRREVQRFRKPLEDLFHTCLAPYVPGELEATVPPVAAAWWTLCAGSPAVLGPIERTGGDDAARAAIAALEAALRERSPAAEWGPRALAAMAALGAQATSLGDVFARLVGVLQTIEAAPPAPALAAQLLGALAAVTRAMLAVGHDLDDALGPANTHAPAPTAPPSWIARAPETMHTARPDDAEPWERLVPLVSAVVAPIARRLAEAAARPQGFVAVANAAFGPYVLVDRLGRGGMGEVWRARRGRRPVALKLARTDVSERDRATLAAALRAEAENLEPLAFAKVAVLLDAGVIADVPYLATSYVRGRTLYTHLIADEASDTAGRQLPIVRRVVRDICIGLDNLHRHGLVHRDLKPTNVMLRMRGTDAEPLRSIADDPRGDDIDEAVLIDFGIAHAFHLPTARGGTPGYAAPETIAQEPVGPAADIYALGATIFHLLARRPLTGDRELGAALVWHLQTEPFEDPDVRAAAAVLPPELAGVIAAALRRDPEARISLAELRRAFD